MLKFRILSVILGLAVGFTLVELVLWIAGIEPPRLRGKQTLLRESDRGLYYHLYPTNPNSEFQPLPQEVRQGRWLLLDNRLRKQPIPFERIKDTPWCVEYRISSQQLRDREYTLTPTAEVSRIAMVGDSFVYGEGVPYDSILPQRVEALLGDNYEVVNGGRSGIGTMEEVEMLQGPVQRFGCHRAIVVFIANDVQLTQRLRKRQKFINDLINIREEYLSEHETQTWYTGHLRMLHFVGSFFDMRRIRQETIQWYLDSYDTKHNAENLDQLVNHFHEMATLPNCRVALVLFPLMESLEQDYPLASIHEQIAAWAREAGLPTLDLAPVFRGMDTSSLQVHPCDHHPNGKAHAIAAKAIVQWLRSDVPGFLEK